MSYAQNFEDVILWRALKHVEQGFYIDIGAQHPEIDSISFAFYQKGWRGVNVEPVKLYSDLLRERRPGEQVIDAVVGSIIGDVDFFEIEGTGLSTASYKVADAHAKRGFEIKRRRVREITLDSLLDIAHGDVNWLKIDVEGYELEVLSGWKNSTVRPWIVVIESTFPNTERDISKEWEHLILGKGYRLIYCDGLNRFYLHTAHEGLSDSFKYPPNIWDEFQLSEHAVACSWTKTILQNQFQQRQIEMAREVALFASRAKQLAFERLQLDRSLTVAQKQNENLAIESARLEKELEFLARRSDRQRSDLIGISKTLADTNEQIQSLTLECETLRSTNIRLEREVEHFKGRFFWRLITRIGRRRGAEADRER